MSLSVFEWVVAVEIAVLLFFVWNSDRRLRQLMAETLHALNDVRGTVEMVSASLLGIDSPFGFVHKKMVATGVPPEYALERASGLPNTRLGTTFVQMLHELKKIRRGATGTSKESDGESRGGQQ
jgi:hypothetical protein